MYCWPNHRRVLCPWFWMWRLKHIIYKKKQCGVKWNLPVSVAQLLQCDISTADKLDSSPVLLCSQWCVQKVNRIRKGTKEVTSSIYNDAAPHPTWYSAISYVTDKPEDETWTVVGADLHMTPVLQLGLLLHCSKSLVERCCLGLLSVIFTVHIIAMKTSGRNRFGLWFFECFCLQQLFTIRLKIVIWLI